MNPITKALDEIRFSIPAQILDEAFIGRDLRNVTSMVSLETRIRETVLEPRVFVDMDIKGGTEAFIPLDTHNVTTQQTDPYTAIYHISDDVTQGRPIVQVYSIHFAALGYQNAGMALNYTESAMSGQLRRVLDSARQTPPAMTSYLNLIAHNTVMARYVYLPFTTAFMRVRLGNDNALSHIRAQMIPYFANLCVLAVKAYIYNHMTVIMDQGQLSGGQMLGTFREVIQGYADANEMYREELRQLPKQSVLNDPEAMRRHVRSIVPI